MKNALDCTKPNDDEFEQTNACHAFFNQVMIFIVSYTTNYSLQSYEGNQKCKLISNRESNKRITHFSLNSTVVNMLTSNLLMRSMRCLNLCLLKCFVPMLATLFSVWTYWMEILPSVTSSRIKKKRNAMCLVLKLKDRFPNACRVAVLSQYTGICSNSVPNPSSVSILNQNTAFFIARVDATSSVCMVDIAVRPCSPDLKLIGAIASIVT